MKLQKYLAHAGLCSRRKAEEYIADGLVMVNGETAHIGQVIDPEKDEISINNQVIKDQEKLVYYIFNKPRGIVTTCLSGHPDEKGIMDVVDFPERVFPIGRLDKETTGLILLTNDGRLSNFLIHPRYEHQKEYLVEVYGKIEDEALEKMRRGVKIELKENSRNKRAADLPPKMYRTKPCLIERLSAGKFSIVLEEGKNRQIRRMVAAVGHDIKRLKRVRIENIKLGNLVEGEARPLMDSEKNTLFSRLNLENFSEK